MWCFNGYDLLLATGLIMLVALLALYTLFGYTFVTVKQAENGVVVRGGVPIDAATGRPLASEGEPFDPGNATRVLVVVKAWGRNYTFPLEAFRPGETYGVDDSGRLWVSAQDRVLELYLGGLTAVVAAVLIKGRLFC